ncbi:MAG: YitT family protein [Lachnospiraceae bacterium]|nr:YitT family protein [Lachnospiraceae bacterium]
MTIFKIVAGGILLAMAVNFVFEPSGMVTGGVSGIGIIVKNVTQKLPLVGRFASGVPVWLTCFILNFFLFIAGYFVMGKEFIRGSILGAGAFNIALYVIPVYPVQAQDDFLAAIFGGILNGLSIGLVMSSNASTGGSDLLGNIIYKIKPFIRPAYVLMITDALIIAMGGVVFGVNKALYAITAIFISAKVTDMILEGPKGGKLVYIISEKWEIIASDIMKNMERGVSNIKIKGMYTKNDKNMLVCVVFTRELPALKRKINQIDESAFVIICNVREVKGEGFIKKLQ